MFNSYRFESRNYITNINPPNVVHYNNKTRVATLTCSLCNSTGKVKDKDSSRRQEKICPLCNGDKIIVVKASPQQLRELNIKEKK